MASHRWKLALAWLAVSGVLAGLLFFTASAGLRQALSQHLEQHLLLTLDESHFSSAEGRVSDASGLANMTERINASLVGVVQSRWYAPLKDCAVSIARIDDLEIESAIAGDSFRLRLPRNQIERELVIGLSCSRNWLVAGWGSALLGLLFVLAAYALPVPLARSHRHWINYLLGHGYAEPEAIDIVGPYGAEQLELNEVQRDCLERLHQERRHNAAAALAVATDPRVASLQASQLDWLLLGLDRQPGDLDGALALSRAGDEVVVDLVARKLTVRGVEVPVGTTPLFYYAWYALRRIAGDGWVSNPASNRPDAAAGVELVALMGAHGGHARAINDLEQAGLKARTLDQNRSKLKDEMVATLGDELATLYLFESKKDADGLHMRYRLRPEGHHFRVIT